MSDGIFTFVLTGARAGKTCVVDKFQFVNGRLSIRIDNRKLGGLATYLGRTYAAFLEGSDELAKRQQKEACVGSPDAAQGARSGDAAAVRGGLPDNGSTGPQAAAVGVGTADAPPATSEHGADGYGHPDIRLRQAVERLDPKDPEHWTEAGKPRLDAVAKFFGAATVTRKDIDRVAPDIVNKPGG